MQKKIIALAVAGLVSGAAFAQSNVTIYGVADVGVEYGNYGDGSKFRVQSGQSAGSRLGFKGEEALGNGLSAIWTAEMGLSFDNGESTTHSIPGVSSILGGSAGTYGWNGSPNTNGTSIFQRQVFAGLKSTQFGQVTVGRQYTPGFYVKAMADAFGLGTAGTANNTWAKLGAFSVDRLDNEVQYLTPTFAGFTGGVGYSSGVELYNTPGASVAAAGANSAAQVSNNSKKAGQTWGGLLTYSGYGANVGLAYHDVQGLTGAQAGAINGSAVVAAAADNNEHIRGWILGGNYDVMGYAKVYAGYATNKSTRNDTNNALNGNNTNRGDVWNVGVKVPFGAHSVAAQYTRWNDKLAADNDFTVWGLGYEYAMSKRTALYAAYAHGTNKNTGVSTLHTAVNTGMQITDNSAVANSGRGYDPHAFNLGLRHSF